MKVLITQLQLQGVHFNTGKNVLLHVKSAKVHVIRCSFDIN